MVPKGVTSRVTAIKLQEEISKASGIDSDKQSSESSKSKQEPKMMHSESVISTLGKLNMTEERYSDLVAIIRPLSCDPLFKVISAKEILEVFNSKRSGDHEIESKIYTLNTMLEVLGLSLDPNRDICPQPLVQIKQAEGTSILFCIQCYHRQFLT